jgi:hypothetical protein
VNVRNRTHAYIGSRKRCSACPQKAQCTTGQYWRRTRKCSW